MQLALQLETLCTLFEGRARVEACRWPEWLASYCQPVVSGIRGGGTLNEGSIA